jgi:hypothetical protein
MLPHDEITIVTGQLSGWYLFIVFVEPFGKHYIHVDLFMGSKPVLYYLNPKLHPN